MAMQIHTITMSTKNGGKYGNNKLGTTTHIINPPYVGLIIYGNVTTHLRKIFKIALTTFMILLIVVLLIGGGHGFYWPAKLVYPYSMLIAILTENEIGIFPTIIAIAQIPIYALILAKKPKWKFYVIGIHIILAIICLNLTTETFYG